MTPSSPHIGPGDAPLVAQPPQHLPARKGVHYGEAFGALFKSPHWVRTSLTGGFLALIPILGSFVVQGWSSEIIKRVHLGHPQPVPPMRFEDIGYWFKRGVAPFVTNILLSMTLSFAINIVAVPAMIVLVALGAMLGEGFLIGASILMFGAFMLLGFGTMPLFHAAMTRAELTEDLSMALQGREVWEYTKGTFGIGLAASVMISLAATAAILGGMMAFGVGMLVAISFAVVSTAHMRAQIYNDWLARGGAQIPTRPIEMLPSELTGA